MSRSGILLATGHPRRTIVNNCFDKYSNVIFGCVVVFVILNFTVLRMAEEIFLFLSYNNSTGKAYILFIHHFY